MAGSSVVCRIIFITITYLLCHSQLVAADDDDPLLVKTQQGSLVGTEVTNQVNNDVYYGFYNIPYAQKPIGSKRFMDPEEPLPWEGVREAKEEGNACLSVNPIFQTVVGDEDCLVLNVYTPKRPSELQESPRPVMFWIHGGAFHMGSSSPLFYGPDFLIMQDVVIVTINYRLNIFGFLSLQNEEIPGNAGLKDQVMALKWVKANILSFGGDPNSITIFGESAGGASVHYLMLSPSAKGLFDRAILQSGNALNPWAATKSTVDTASKVGGVFNCETGNLTELARCLREVDAEELAQYQYNVALPKIKEALNFNLFLPCIEPIDSKNPFLTTKPRSLLQEGQYNDVPFIIGTMEMETLALSKLLTGNTVPENVLADIFSMANKNPALILTLKLSDVPPQSQKKVGEEIKKFYFKNLPISRDTMVNIINATSDINFLLGTNDVVSYHLTHGSSPVYQYHFTLVSDFGRVSRFLETPIKGPSHADDLGYLFFMHIAPPTLNPEGTGYKSMLKIVKLWTNFAKYGNPTPDSELNVEWKPATSEGNYYLEIGEEFIMKEDVEKERMNFWHNLRLSEDLQDF